MEFFTVTSSLAIFSLWARTKILRLLILGSPDLGRWHEPKTGIYQGTERYMAPIFVINTEYSPHVDIWALGSTVYELITGHWCGKMQMVIMCWTKLSFRNQSFRIQSVKWGSRFSRKMFCEESEHTLDCGQALEPNFYAKFVQSSQNRNIKEEENWFMSLLHKPIQKITFKIYRHKFSRQLLDSKPLLDKPIKKITFNIGNHKFVRWFPVLKKVDNETCGRLLITDNR